MTNSKKQAAQKQLVAVDARKLGQGLKTTFEGVAMVFDALGADADFPVMEEASVVEQTGEEDKTDAAEKTGHDAVAFATPAAPSESGDVKAEHTDDDETDQEDTVITETTETESVEAETVESDTTEAEPEPAKKSAPTPTVTQDDVTKVIVQKIKQDRSNNARIGQILKTYGVSKVGELPASRYEAFLTDLAAL